MKLLSVFGKICEILKRNNAVKELRLKPELVGVHPLNRSGKLVTSRTMAAKGSKIVSVGYSAAVVAGRPWAFAEHPTEKRVRASMAKMVATAPDEFGALASEYIAGSVGCGHLNQFLLAVAQARVTNEPALQDKAGRIDKQRLFQQDPALADAATHGLLWSIVDYEVEERLPKLADLMQRALNIEHAIHPGKLFARCHPMDRNCG